MPIDATKHLFLYRQSFLTYMPPASSIRSESGSHLKCLPEIVTACCKSRFILGHDLDFWQGGLDFRQVGLDFWQGGLDSDWAVSISGRSVLISGRAVSICSRAVSISGRSEKNKNGTKRGAKADRHPGPRTKVNAMSREHISEKNENGTKLIND